MNNFVLFIVITLLPLISCKSSGDSIETWKMEIIESERDFARMAREDGLEKAFLTYAADEAVLMRNNHLIVGKDAIRERFLRLRPASGSVTLSWEPDFVDVSLSGDLGYTYGRYMATTTDSLGNIQQDSGVFHTVWKRQADGNWRYVWD